MAEPTTLEKIIVCAVTTPLSLFALYKMSRAFKGYSKKLIDEQKEKYQEFQKQYPK